MGWTSGILAPLAMGAVFIVLGLGIYTMFKGGPVRGISSNKLMRLRVIFQAVAVVLLLAWLGWMNNGA